MTASTPDQGRDLGALDSEMLGQLRSIDAVRPGFLARVTKTYIESSSLVLERIRASCTDLDASGLRAAAHELKGSSLSVGAAVFGALCSELEQACRDEDSARIQDCSAEVERALPYVHESLRRCLG